jgi:hypothetical protein
MLHLLIVQRLITAVCLLTLLLNGLEDWVKNLKDGPLNSSSGADLILRKNVIYSAGEVPEGRVDRLMYLIMLKIESIVDAIEILQEAFECGGELRDCPIACIARVLVKQEGEVLILVPAFRELLANIRVLSS